MRYPHFLLIPLLCFFSGLHAIEANLTPLLKTLIEIANIHHQDPSKTIPLVAIGGCPGVGKTYFTNKLLLELQKNGVDCMVLPLDHFNLSPEERRKIGTEWDMRHFKMQELHECLAQIFSGAKTIQKPTYQQLTGEIGVESLELNTVDLILFDGLYALCSVPPLNFFDYCSVGIFLEAEEADISAWKWERELKKTQHRTPEQFLKHMEALLADYHQNIEYSKSNARFVIRKNSDHAYTLEIQSDSSNSDFTKSCANHFSYSSEVHPLSKTHSRYISRPVSVHRISRAF